MTPKQKTFIAEYLIDLNATQAAIRAGYSKRSAYSQGQRLLKLAVTAKAIAKSQHERAERTKTNADWVINELVSNHVTATEDRNLAQSTRALELIGKHHGAFDKSAHVGDVTVTIIKPKRIEDYTDEELGEIIARGESERAGDEQAANIDLNLDGVDFPDLDKLEEQDPILKVDDLDFDRFKLPDIE